LWAGAGVGGDGSGGPTGGSRRQGGITKTGNRHLRRILVEAAWSYGHRPAVKTTVRGRQAGQPARVRDIAWKAQDRLLRKYTRLLARGKPVGAAVTAVARELLGFVWAIACLVETGWLAERAA
jgi:transposase